MPADTQGPVLYFDNLRKWHEDLPHAPLVAGPQAPVFMHGPRPKTSMARRSGPARGMLGILLVLGGCVAVVCWNARPAATGAAPQTLGIDLRADGPAPKFNKTSAEAPKLPAPPSKTDKQKIELPPEPELPKPPAMGFVPVPPPAPTAPKPPLEEPKFLMPVVFLEPGSLACSCFRGLQRGESPMKSHWNMIKVTTAVTAALVLAPTPAPAQGVTNKELKDSIDALKKQVDDNHTALLNSQNQIMKDGMQIRTDLKALADANANITISLQTMQGEMAGLEAKVKKLQDDFGKLKSTDGGPSATDKAIVAEIKARLDQIDARIAKLEEGRVSKSLPVNAPGKIFVANMYPETMLVLINDVPYRVEPGTTRTVENVAPGMFKYEVISGSYGSVRTNRPTLEPGKTYTITIR